MNEDRNVLFSAEWRDVPLDSGEDDQVRMCAARLANGLEVRVGRGAAPAVGVIRNGDRVTAELLCLFDDLLDAVRAIRKPRVGVRVDFQPRAAADPIDAADEPRCLRRAPFRIARGRAFMARTTCGEKRGAEYAARPRA